MLLFQSKSRASQQNGVLAEHDSERYSLVSVLPRGDKRFGVCHRIRMRNAQRSGRDLARTRESSKFERVCQGMCPQQETIGMESRSGHPRRCLTKPHIGTAAAAPATL